MAKGPTRKQANKRKAAPPAQQTASIQWEGDSKDVISEWPRPVKEDLGLSLWEMQCGRKAALEVRPMPSVGEGVFELKTDDANHWYRLMYLARIGNKIYVLDCFKKNTRKTEKKDLERSQARYQQVQQKLREERTDAKRKKGRQNS